MRHKPEKNRGRAEELGRETLQINRTFAGLENGSGLCLRLHTTDLRRLISEQELQHPARSHKADKRVTFGLICRPHLDPRAHEGKEEEDVLEPTTPSNQSCRLLEVLQHEVRRFERKKIREKDDEPSTSTMHQERTRKPGGGQARVQLRRTVYRAQLGARIVEV